MLSWRNKKKICSWYSLLSGAMRTMILYLNDYHGVCYLCPETPCKESRCPENDISFLVIETICKNTIRNV